MRNFVSVREFLKIKDTNILTKRANDGSAVKNTKRSLIMGLLRTYSKYALYEHKQTLRVMARLVYSPTITKRSWILRATRAVNKMLLPTYFGTVPTRGFVRTPAK